MPLPDDDFDVDALGADFDVDALDDDFDVDALDDDFDVDELDDVLLEDELDDGLLLDDVFPDVVEAGFVAELEIPELCIAVRTPVQGPCRAQANEQRCATSADHRCALQPPPPKTTPAIAPTCPEVQEPRSPTTGRLNES